MDMQVNARRHEVLPFWLRAHIAFTAFNFLYLLLVLLPLLSWDGSPRSSNMSMIEPGGGLYPLASPVRWLLGPAQLVFILMSLPGLICCFAVLIASVMQWRGLFKGHQYLTVLLQALSWSIVLVAWTTGSRAGYVLFN